ncbi:MAG: hypothetical protein AAB535_03395, partial [Patescibacteria group bacterium]
MTKQLNLPETPINVLQKILEACDKTFVTELGTQDFYTEGQTTWSIPEIGLVYEAAQTQEIKNSEKETLRQVLTDLTGEKNVRRAYAVVNETIESRSKSTKPAEQPSATKPADLETLLEKADIRERAEAKTRQVGIDRAQEFLRREQEKVEKLKEIIKNKEVRVKIEAEAVEVELSANKAEAIKNLKNEAVQNQKAVTEQLAEEIKTRIAENTPPEIIDAISGQTALDVVQTIQGGSSSPVVQIASYQQVSKNPKVEKEVKDILQLLTDQKITQLELSKQIFGQAFGDEASKGVFAQPGYEGTFSLSQIPEQYSENLSNQNNLLENIKGLGVDEAKARIGSHFGSLIDKRITALPEGHFLRSEFVSNTLGVFGLGAPVKWIVAEGASPIMKFAVSSGYGPLLGTIQSATGWNLGISKAVSTAGGQAVSKAVAGTAVKKGLSGVISKVVMGAGALASWATFGLSLIIGAIIGKVLEKIPWDKVKKALPYIVGGVLFPFLGPIAAIAGGVGTALLGGASLAGIGAGIGAFFWTIGRATAITIGTPIIVTLLVFPVVVALILFIIRLIKI